MVGINEIASDPSREEKAKLAVLEKTADQAGDEEIDKVPLPIGLGVFVVVLLLFVYGGFTAKKWLEDEQRVPVQEIVFSGELNVLSPEDLEQIVRQFSTGSFFALDVNEVHDLIESQSWVYSASVRKRWPSKLYIHIIEEQAVARWNGDLLINRYGDTFEGEGEESKLRFELPELYGPGGSEKTALTGYVQMQRLLNTSGQKISELILSERFAWQARLDNQVLLKLGRQEYINRLQRYIDVYPLLLEEGKGIEYVDLRYDTGLAVAWKDGSSQPII